MVYVVKYTALFLLFSLAFVVKFNSKMKIDLIRKFNFFKDTPLYKNLATRRALRKFQENKADRL